MDWEFESAAARGLRCYVELVAEALKLTGPGWMVQLDPPVSAYVAVDLRHPDFPGWDTALLWHELYGWSLAVEPRASGDLRVVGYLGGDVLPDPGTVAAFAVRETGAARAGRPAVRPDPPRLRDGSPDDLLDRLAGYAATPGDRAVRDTACGAEPVVPLPLG
ncbi:MAG TPA: DUF6292 family protein [Actinophytocola sp.]|uniref:DUF6292 family protein n=1 Tax=Actinophytocola sp. TaxID=1872138 RepID=UPI002DBE5D63|nr:DUF6292 family protein [Actinophytocola sp.]HEU5475630.1 DUF6292 family protein [Actinophytocola sp.]